MPYSASHKATTRSHVIDVARRVFCFKGFDATTIDDVMQAAGMTRGAFYAHFESKAALYQEAMRSPGDHEPGLGLLDALGSIVHQPMGLANPRCAAHPRVKDILSGVPEVRRVVEASLTRLLRKGGGDVDRSDLLALVSMAVGAAILGEAIEDRLLQSDLREACLATVRDLLEQPAGGHDASELLWSPEAGNHHGTRQD